MITYLQAIIIAIVQGVTELFPISSLGHSILLAKLFGWTEILGEQSQKGSHYLVFLVALHVATAIALIIFYRKTWLVLIKAFFRLCRTRKITTPAERMIFYLIIGTIPAALLGFIFESSLRKIFATPIIAAIFLVINGIILLYGEKIRQRGEQRRRTTTSMNATEHQVTTKLTAKTALGIGIAQSAALIAGISRSGITMTYGLLAGLSHENAARFSFLLATPIILGAGLYKLPELAKPAFSPMLPQTVIGALVAGVAAYLAVKFLDRYFEGKTLRPFGIYCIVFGLFMMSFIGIVG